LLGKIVAFPLVIGFLYSNRAARETPRVATVPFFHDIGADVVRLLGPGAFFGEMSLLVGSPRNATIVATESCTLLALDIVDFRGLLGCQPDLARIIHEEADRRLAATAVRFIEIGCSVLAPTLVMVVITGLDPVIHAFFPF